MGTADTIETLRFPRPPSEIEAETTSDLIEANKGQAKWNREVARFNNELYNILHSGNLVRSFRVEELTADKIAAGTIGVDQIFLGSSKFELDGVLEQIRLDDAQGSPVTRLEIGKFGSGADYGIKVRDSSGTVVFQAASTTFLNGATITNASIDDSKISGVDGSKLAAGSVTGSKIASLTITDANIANATITNAKISDLSATKINTGTLTVDGSPAITVTSAGALTFTSGGDIIMKASGTNFNYIKFQTSAGSTKAQLTYDSSSDLFSISDAGGTANFTINFDTIDIGVSAAQVVDINADIASSLIPDTDNLRNVGSASSRWADVRSVLINGADFCFENGFRITEINHVYEGHAPNEAVCFMNDDWETIAILTRDGNMTIRGTMRFGYDFVPPQIERREAAEDKEDEPRNRENLN